MIRQHSIRGAFLAVSLSAAALAAACGGDGVPISLFNEAPGAPGDSGAKGPLSDATTPDLGSLFGDGAVITADGNVPVGSIVIAPLDAVINVVNGQTPPTLHYTATSGGKPVGVSWSIDGGEIATFDPATGVLTPKGTIGGKATVTADYHGTKTTTTVTVKIHVTQNGSSAVAAGDAGAADSGDAGDGGQTGDAGAAGSVGGAGGVGGEGPGGPVSAATMQTLLGVPGAAPGLGWLYPYDRTVWPRGLLAPLMQWTAGDTYDAVYVHVTETAYEYQGFFAKTADPFVHHPIPQGIWNQIGYSNDGEDVVVTLVFSKGSNLYGPITQSWRIARGTLKGTVYYNSYGTNLAMNSCTAGGPCLTTKGTQFGGATLAIRGGSTDPVLVAGDNQNCRVCHSVAAQGAMLVTEHGDGYGTASAYALTSANAETLLNPGDGRFTFGAISPDGSMLFSNASPLPGTTSQASALYTLPSGAPVVTTGLPTGLAAGMPAFSPDGRHVAYNFWGGTGSDRKSLAVIDFTAPATLLSAAAFGAATTIFTPQTGTAVWPSFMPTNDGVVFELETMSNGRDFAATRSSCDDSASCSDTGARGELWWADMKTKQAQRLDNANGLGFLPPGPQGHNADTTLNYEPTVNPVPSGGYAWVVFTSRRLYGNVATINPFWSDPRFHDISETPTTKKLWAAAIDLNAAPGTDPSHPAFYLPAQELLAGNSRGFWVVDPCHMDGATCDTGEECCGGFCRASEDGGPLTCKAQAPGCAQEFEKCATTADCCGQTQGIQCINGRCATEAPAGPK